MKKIIYLVALVAISLLLVQCEEQQGSNNGNNNGTGDSNQENTDVKGEGTGVVDGHAYVDLGLPSGLKWATCNVGATVSTDFGDYFAWGEVESKENYSWDTYKYGNGRGGKFTKYNGIIDKTTLYLEDDAAHVNWGGAWRMPTEEDVKELIENCTFIETSKTDANGYAVFGYKVTGPNGNLIFLPAAGYMNKDTLYGAGSTAFCWSSSLSADNLNYAYQISSRSYGEEMDESRRCIGLSVRPVWEERTTTKKQYTITVSSNNSSYGYVLGGGTYEEGMQVELIAVPNPGYEFQRWRDRSVINPRVITVTKDQSYTAIFAKFEPEYVDLGLSVKWATCNVGATKPEEYGDYFAWGEVKPKTTYDWSTYKHCKGTYEAMTKYCGNSDYGKGGFTDAKIVLDPEDDAATVNWGIMWRMPTLDEQKELYKKCTWTRTTQNGVYGCKVTGPNGKSIFLPAAGNMAESTVKYAGERGNYWSSTVTSIISFEAYFVYFHADNMDYSYDSRCLGNSVRPVYGE